MRAGRRDTLRTCSRCGPACRAPSPAGAHGTAGSGARAGRRRAPPRGCRRTGRCETSCRIRSIGNSGARSSGPTGWPVPGCSTGGGGVGRSCSTLYQRVGISLSSSRILCCRTSAIASSMVRSVPVPDPRLRGVRWRWVVWTVLGCVLASGCTDSSTSPRPAAHSSAGSSSAPADPSPSSTSPTPSPSASPRPHSLANGPHRAGGPALAVLLRRPPAAHQPVVRGPAPGDDRLRLHGGALLRPRPAVPRPAGVPPRRRRRDAVRHEAVRRSRRDGRRPWSPARPARRTGRMRSGSAAATSTSWSATSARCTSLRATRCAADSSSRARTTRPPGRVPPAPRGAPGRWRLSTAVDPAPYLQLSR